jgi:phosphoesterase RecJ-like protein
METIQKLLQAIKNANNIVILSHIGPDGDTLGSMLALKDIILGLDPSKRVDAVMFGKIPDSYVFLPKIKETKTPDNKDLLSSYDLSVTVDCASVDRICDAGDLFRNAKIKANVDHHISNSNFAEINFVNTTASSTGEVIFEISKALGVNLTKDIAVNLYTSLMTDTGGFKYRNTTARTFEIAAELVRAGADPAYIYKECYESKSYPMVKLQAYAVDNAVITPDNKIVYTCISRKNIEKFNASDDHMDGISELLRQINTVEVAMVLKETVKGDTKVSFRSKRINVCEIAKFFGGGGHKLAAGCTVQKSLSNTLNELLPIIRKQLNK